MFLSTPTELTQVLTCSLSVGADWPLLAELGASQTFFVYTELLDLFLTAIGNVAQAEMVTTNSCLHGIRKRSWVK